MKFIIITALTLSSLTIASGDKFETRKAKRLESITKAITNLSKTKSCLESAKDKQSLRACGKNRKIMKNKIRTKQMK